MFMAGADGTAFRVTTKNHSKSFAACMPLITRSLI